MTADATPIARDTIAAVASPPGPAPFGATPRLVVRLSGPRAHEWAMALAPAAPSLPGAHFAHIHLPVGRLAGRLWLFHAPASYTGEDVAEFHLPGSDLIARLIIEQLLRLGARQALPGEFTARAFFHGKLDLAQAEAVALLISADHARQLHAARRLLSGELSRRIAPCLDELTHMLALVEAGIDFADEGIVPLPPTELSQRTQALIATLDQLRRSAGIVRPLAATPGVVLAGRPSAGKSTLLNALLGRRRAAVSPRPGTTRDALSGDLLLPGGLVRLVDVAGLHDLDDDPPETPRDIARQMRQRAWDEAAAAPVLLLVRDISDPRPAIQLPRPPDLLVLSKSDLSPTPPADDRPPEASPPVLAVSAHTGAGLDTLRRRLDELCFCAPHDQPLAISVRHAEALDRALAALASAHHDAARGDELAALALREALNALGEITGRLWPDDILARIFGGFCIGK